MNYFEQQVERYRKRIQKIENDPSQTMLKSNRIFYELMLTQNETLLREWQDGKPFAFACDVAPYRLIKAMGVRPFSPEMGGDYLPRKRVPEFFERVRSTGFPRNACDRVQLTASFILAVEKGELPKPSCAVVTHADCDGMMQSMVWAGRHLQIPTVVIDCPLVDALFEDRWDALKYVEAQLENMIRLLEKEVPGAKYDEQKLAEYHELFAQNMEWQAKLRRLTINKPCPIAGRDALRMPPLDIVENTKIIEYYRESVKELEERVKAGKGATVNQEKGRVGWLVSAPFYTDGFRFLEERGIAVALYEDGPGIQNYPTIHDETLWGRKLTPLECEAAWCISPQWLGTMERRWRVLRERCQELDLDGLVHFELPGCETCNGCARLIADMAKKELGVVSLEIEGWCQDVANFNEADYAARMEAFAERVIQRKTARASNCPRIP